MKEEYDFTNAEQGKFYIPLEEIDIPQSYDFRNGVRGKYASSYHEGVNIVKIDEGET
ncbi:MAG: hypothetical protein M0P91_05840 [Sulfuricurvum sp.]|jgi:hypothetical protein|uniref:hypothetical protein n=1 Tax=Sulfuricurvum sp. TaxID=2025608 RepID=UPI0025E950DF|nr:hypothetical protein [Sulfuricurvum sp.]MCK9372700.1 hypothetical protein [Sulfuricurvum sp.]